MNETTLPINANNNNIIASSELALEEFGWPNLPCLHQLHAK